ncbi:hypothetical protein D3C76_375290 [compost metagenome]
MLQPSFGHTSAVFIDRPLQFCLTHDGKPGYGKVRLFNRTLHHIQQMVRQAFHVLRIEQSTAILQRSFQDASLFFDRQHQIILGRIVMEGQVFQS